MAARHFFRLMRRAFWGLLPVAAAMALSACGNDEELVPMNASAYKDDLETLSKARIFFGHQSVGRNMLQGLTDLSQQVQSPVRIVRIHNEGVDEQPGLFHTDIGKNKEPIGKIEAFSRVLRRSGQRQFDVALLKFCYEDVSRDGMQNPHALVEEYAKNVAAIRAVQPHLRLIHVTVPLRADPASWETWIKRLLDRPTDEDADNQLRNVFNTELRRRFAGEAIFDIAEVESTLPQGQRSFFTHGGDIFFTLAQAYTTDGGHLNERGRRQAAAALVRALAATLRKGG